MKKPSLHLLPLFSLFLLLVQTACKKPGNDTTPPAKPFEAAFTIYEPMYDTKAAYPTDTIINYVVALEAEQGYSTYNWKVGNDPTAFTQRAVQLRFSIKESGQTIPVRLIATKNGQSDTVEKAFTVMAMKGTPAANETTHTAELPYLGQFEGYYEDAPIHKFTVTLTNLDTATVWGTFRGIRILNLPEGCGGKYTAGQNCSVNAISPLHYSYPFEYTYRAFFVNKESGGDVGCCPRVEFYGYLDPADRNKLIVECAFQTNDPNKPIKRKFIGFRR